jgi:hypothetical protein
MVKDRSGGFLGRKSLVSNCSRFHQNVANHMTLRRSVDQMRSCCKATTVRDSVIPWALRREERRTMGRVLIARFCEQKIGYFGFETMFLESLLFYDAAGLKTARPVGRNAPSNAAFPASTTVR